MPVRPRDGGVTAMDAAIALIAILVVVQMWVLTASLESYLAGHSGVALPAALVSGGLAAGSWVLYRFVVRIDRDSREEGDDAEPPATDAGRAPFGQTQR